MNNSQSKVGDANYKKLSQKCVNRANFFVSGNLHVKPSETMEFSI